jgi:hypothetical protein
VICTPKSEAKVKANVTTRFYCSSGEFSFNYYFERNGNETPVLKETATSILPVDGSNGAGGNGTDKNSAVPKAPPTSFEDAKKLCKSWSEYPYLSCPTNQGDLELNVESGFCYPNKPIQTNPCSAGFSYDHVSSVCCPNGTSYNWGKHQCLPKSENDASVTPPPPQR